MAETNPNNLLYLRYMLQDPANALRFQQQQALAQKMMEQGSELPDPTQSTPGPVPTVIKQSPLLYASKAIEQGLGGYLQNKNNQKLATMMQSGQPSASDITNSAIGAGEGPTSAQQLAATMQVMQQKSDPATATGSASSDQIEAITNPELFKFHAALAQEIKKAQLGNQYAGPNKRAESTNTLATGTYTDNKGQIHENVPMMNGAPYSSPAATTQPAPPVNQQTGSLLTPPSSSAPQVNTPPSRDSAWNVGGTPEDMQAAKALAALNSQEISGPSAPTGNNIQPGNIAGAKEQAAAAGTAAGENIGATKKGVIGIDSRYDNVINTLDSMDALNKSKPHGIFGEYVVDPFSRNVGTGEKASNQAQFEQKNANLFTQELGPLLQSIQGTKGSIPLINAIKDASQISPYASEKETHDTIAGLKQQYAIYQKNMHNAESMATGQPSPIPSPQGNAAAVTHQYVPGQGIIPVGGQ